MAPFLHPKALKVRNFKGIAELDLALDEIVDAAGWRERCGQDFRAAGPACCCNSSLGAQDA